MEKGTVMVPPGPMVITKGSLAAITVAEIDATIDVGYVTFNLNLAHPLSNPTKGSLATYLLQENENLVRGEQLTFIIVCLINGEYQYRYESLILDPTDTSMPRSVLTWAQSFEDMLSFSAELAPSNCQFVAACCIRSQAYGESSFKRSTAILACSNDVYLYNDEAAVRAAVASYRTGEDPEDWEDDPTPVYQQLAYVCMVTITNDMVVTAERSNFVGDQCLGYVTKGGEMGVFYLYSNAANANCLLTSDALIMEKRISNVMHYAKFLASYQPSREWSEIYGTMNNV